MARILTWGGTLHSLSIPDAAGMIENCVLGHDDLHGYLAVHSFFGATIGRFGNHIARGRFTVDDEGFSAPANDGPNALHDGPDGFDQRNWTAVDIGTDPNPFVTLELRSPDGDQGFPGNLMVRVTWRLDTGGLDIGMTADCDRPYPISLTNHAFFKRRAGRPRADRHGDEPHPDYARLAVSARRSRRHTARPGGSGTGHRL